jgi:hypothetical protein
MISDYLGLQKQKYQEAVKKAHELLDNFQSHFVVDQTKSSPGNIPSVAEPLRGSHEIPSPPQDEKTISQFQIVKSNPSRTTDVVIGMAQKTDPKNLVVFCGSLRKSSSPSPYPHL